MKTIYPQKRLVLVTAIIILTASTLLFWLGSQKEPIKAEIDTTRQPTLGSESAKVHLVLIEEPKCSFCRQFNNASFESLKRDFIDTGKIRYTVIMVSFLPNSMPAAEALLAVYNNCGSGASAEAFFNYLDYMYRHQPSEDTDWATTHLLLDYAKKSNPNAPLEKLKLCLENHRYQSDIYQNTEYCRKILDGRLMTPTLFINGVQVPENALKKVVPLIKKALEENR